MAKNYWDWKKQSPEFPFIVRECEEIDPYVLVRYSKRKYIKGEFGVEKKALVGNLSEQELDGVLRELVAQGQKVNSSI